LKHHGGSSQGVPVAVITSDDGTPVRVNLTWRARCGIGRFQTRTSFLGPFDHVTHDAVRDAGRYRFSDGRYRYRVGVTLRGHRVSARKWRGRFSGVAVVRRAGRTITRCRSGLVRWRARYHYARVEVSGDQNDSITVGRQFLWESPRDYVRGWATKRSIYFRAEPLHFTFDFQPPRGKRLRTKRYTGARDLYAGGRRRPEMAISGDGRGCAELTGWFEIHRFRVDRRGLRTLSISFEQRCDNSGDVLRGSINYRR
jgi:hypothetical protein